jgi:hypothetical protein
MKTRFGALVAPLAAAVVVVAATAGVAAAMTALEPGAGVTAAIPAATPRPTIGAEREVRSALSDRSTVPPTDPAARAEDRPAEGTEVVGLASNYPGTAGWMGQPTVALPGDLGGRYTGAVNGHVTVCADRCVTLPVVDWCQCYWGTDDQRIVDLSHPAWALVSDAPLATGLVEVRLVLEPATSS